MKNKLLPGEVEVKANLRGSISAFCRWRVNNNLCDDSDTCEFCPVQKTYEMARESER